MHKALPDALEHDDINNINSDEDSKMAVDIITLENDTIDTTDDKVAINTSDNAHIDVDVDIKASHENANQDSVNQGSTSSVISSKNASSETIKPAHVTTGSSLTPRSRLNKTPKLIANGSYAVIWYGLSLLVLLIDQWTK